jgi:hypothetical protein
MRLGDILVGSRLVRCAGPLRVGRDGLRIGLQ